MSKKSFARIIRIVTGTFGSAREDLFSVEKGLTRFERFVHFWVLVSQSFARNRCPVRASALSFTTLLALIPMLAVAMSVSSILLKTTTSEEQIKSFVEQFIEHMVPGGDGAVSSQETRNVTQAVSTNAITDVDSIQLAGSNVVSDISGTNGLVAAVTTTNAPATPVAESRITATKRQAADMIYTFIHNTYGGSLGAIGVVFLLWTTIATLTRVEETFNDIWGVTRGRDWWSRIANYLITTLIGPVLILAALGLMGGTYFQKSRELLGIVPFLEPLVSTLLPVVIICVTFTLFYKAMPNTKVNFSAAFAGGAIAGTSWHVFNVISLHFATRVVNASKIYGSLALVPLLMVGLYTVWVIVLFGAQVAYAFQNRESYLQERLAENVNQRGREFVAFRLMTCIGQRFERGLPPPTTQEISRELGIPSKLVQQVLQTLLAARLVVEVAGLEHAYAPARPLEAINAHHILIAMRATHGQDFITQDEPVRAEIYGEFARIQAAEERAASAVTMLALVNRVHPQIAAPPTVLIPSGGPAIETASPTDVESTVADVSTDIPLPTKVVREDAGVSSSVAPSVAEVEAARPTTTPAAMNSTSVTTPVPASVKTSLPETSFASASNDDNESFPL